MEKVYMFSHLQKYSGVLWREQAQVANAQALTPGSLDSRGLPADDALCRFLYDFTKYWHTSNESTTFHPLILLRMILLLPASCWFSPLYTIYNKQKVLFCNIFGREFSGMNEITESRGINFQGSWFLLSNVVSTSDFQPWSKALLIPLSTGKLEFSRGCLPPAPPTSGGFIHFLCAPDRYSRFLCGLWPEKGWEALLQRPNVAAWRSVGLEGRKRVVHTWLHHLRFHLRPVAQARNAFALGSS